MLTSSLVTLVFAPTAIVYGSEFPHPFWNPPLFPSGEPILLNKGRYNKPTTESPDPQQDPFESLTRLKSFCTDGWPSLNVDFFDYQLLDRDNERDCKRMYDVLRYFWKFQFGYDPKSSPGLSLGIEEHEQHHQRRNYVRDMIIWEGRNATGNVRNELILHRVDMSTYRFLLHLTEGRVGSREYQHIETMNGNELESEFMKQSSLEVQQKHMSEKCTRLQELLKIKSNQFAQAEAQTLRGQDDLTKAIAEKQSAGEHVTILQYRLRELEESTLRQSMEAEREFHDQRELMEADRSKAVAKFEKERTRATETVVRLQRDMTRGFVDWETNIRNMMQIQANETLQRLDETRKHEEDVIQERAERELQRIEEQKVLDTEQKLHRGQLMMTAYIGGGVSLMIIIVSMMLRWRGNKKNSEEMTRALNAQRERILRIDPPVPVIPSAHAARLGVHEHPAVRDQFGMKKPYDVTAGEGFHVGRVTSTGGTTIPTPEDTEGNVGEGNPTSTLSAETRKE